MEELQSDIRACRLCAERFGATHTGHTPRPVVWFGPKPRILIAGQAPGLRVHQSGKPFDDPSGDRLRDWMGVDPAVFYDVTRVAIVPMAFCFPGYDANGSDLPPPPVCRKTWHDQVTSALGDIPLRLIIGGYAHKYHLRSKANVTDTVAAWRNHGPSVFPLPHPSWRNTGWIKRNPWFENELLPGLKSAVEKALT